MGRWGRSTRVSSFVIDSSFGFRHSSFPAPRPRLPETRRAPMRHRAVAERIFASGCSRRWPVLSPAARLDGVAGGRSSFDAPRTVARCVSLEAARADAAVQRRGRGARDGRRAPGGARARPRAGDARGGAVVRAARRAADAVDHVRVRVVAVPAAAGRAPRSRRGAATSRGASGRWRRGCGRCRPACSGWRCGGSTSTCSSRRCSTGRCGA